MPRIARKDFETSFFHVMIQGVNKEYIFYKDEYIEKYEYLLHKYSKEYKILILSYCIMNNHAHILIYTENVEEMAKYMHKINGIYGQYYNREENRVGIVFRNRYESEAIYNIKHLTNCIKYIHMNPVKAGIVKKCEDYKYSSSKDYANNTGVAPNAILLNVVDANNLNNLNNSEGDIIFNDVDNNKNEILEKGIKRFEKEKCEELINILANRNSLKKLIKFLKINYKVTYVEMMKRFNITKGEMELLKR